jgi:thiosulfate/3-mercaptopyruvate sulfurtransferase
MSRSDVLVDADWVEAHLGDPGVVLVEVDEDTSAYDKGHIANAVKLDWKKDLQDPVRRDFVDKHGFEELLSDRGISNDDLVILYGGNNNWFAAYAYWYFRLYGHTNVKLLDGGRKKWELDSRDLVTEVPNRPRTSYRAADPDTSIRAFRDEVVAAIGQRNLVDVRSPDEFSGKLLAPAHLPQEQAQRAGHIPTARNVPWSKAANDDGTFKSDDDLRKLYGDEAGLDFGKDTIAYCRIGERSAHTWFVLHELLGQPNVKNYDGSWTEYGSLVGVPIELGAGR